jgi:hypothetical protein
VNAWATDTEYDFSYQTHVTANTTAGITPEFDLDWRHCIAEGTIDAPLLTSTRWRKTFGSSAITLLEGSIVLAPLEGDPNVTEVRYQYHLDAQFTRPIPTIEAYLNVIYGRLRDLSHGAPLVPNDCTGCPEPPAEYMIEWPVP